MTGTRVFVARLTGSGVFDTAGDRLGRIRDVLVVYRKDNAPRVVGLLAELPGKRRVFISIGRVSSIGSGQVITTGPISDRKFEQRGGEVRLLAEFLGRKVTFNDGSGDAEIEDAAIEETGPGEWAISQLFVRRPRQTGAPFAKGPTALVPWSLITEKTEAGEPQSAEALIASYSELRPADLANTLLDLPQERMLEVAEELPDDRLADVLEEMDESDQIEIMAQLDDDIGIVMQKLKDMGVDDNTIVIFTTDNGAEAISPVTNPMTAHFEWRRVVAAIVKPVMPVISESADAPIVAIWRSVEALLAQVLDGGRDAQLCRRLGRQRAPLLEQPREAVVAVDDAPVQVVEVGGGKAPAFERHERP